MPIDLAEVDWFYVVLLAVFVAVSTFLGGLLSFKHRGAGAILSALFFTAIFVLWTYYPHRVPFLPRTLNKTQETAVKPAPAPAPAAPQRPSNPVRDITPPKNPVTDITPPATPAR